MTFFRALSDALAAGSGAGAKPSLRTVSSGPWLWGLLGMVLLGAVLRIHLFIGWLGFDDVEYARLAYRMTEGSFSAGYLGPVVFPLRVGLTGPAAALFGVFGLSEWTMALYPLVLSLLGICVAYLCAALFFGPLAGLLAAGMVAILPGELGAATVLLPDLPSAVFAGAAVTVVVALDRLEVRRRSALIAGGLGAGLLLGFSWLCKESVAYLAPFCAVYLAVSIWKHGSRMAWVWGGVAVGSLAVLATEMLAYSVTMGDFLYRFHQVDYNYVQNQKYFFAEGSRFGWDEDTTYRQALLNRLFVSGPRTILLNPVSLFLPLVGLGATVYGWVRKDRSFLLPGVWLWTLVLMFNFSSSSLTSYTPLALFDRYLHPIFLPSIVLSAGFLARAAAAQGLAGRGRAWLVRTTAAVTALFLAFVGAQQLHYRLQDPPGPWSAEVHTLRSLAQPGTVLYADTLTLRAFEFFAAFPRQTAWTDFADLGSADEIEAGSLVLVNRRYIQWLDLNGGIWGSTQTGYRSHPFYVTPPESWQRIWHNTDVSLYWVEGAGPPPEIPGVGEQ